MKPAVLMSWAALLMVALMASAQAEKRTPTQAPLPSANPCQARPDDGAANKGQSDGRKSGQSNDLSQALEPCEGILKPPPTGDREMTTPPPAKGNTPVIRPGEIPQQPKQD